MRARDYYSSSRCDARDGHRLPGPGRDPGGLPHRRHDAAAAAQEPRLRDRHHRGRRGAAADDRSGHDAARDGSAGASSTSSASCSPRRSRPRVGRCPTRLPRPRVERPASLRERMLFDLRGRRRRAVQAIYLMLAVLMGGGLVLFGIGGDVSGGFLDAFTGGGGGGGNDAIEKRIDKREQQLSANPKNEARCGRSCATTTSSPQRAVPEGTSAFPQDAAGDLRKAAGYWQRYLELGRRQGRALAGWTSVPDVWPRQRSTSPRTPRRRAASSRAPGQRHQLYLQLVQYATVAGDKRTADLAGRRPSTWRRRASARPSRSRSRTSRSKPRPRRQRPPALRARPPAAAE